MSKPKSKPEPVQEEVSMRDYLTNRISTIEAEQTTYSQRFNENAAVLRELRKMLESVAD